MRLADSPPPYIRDLLESAGCVNLVRIRMKRLGLNIKILSQGSGHRVNGSSGHRKTKPNPPPPPRNFVFRWLGYKQRSNPLISGEYTEKPENKEVARTFPPILSGDRAIGRQERPLIALMNTDLRREDDRFSKSPSARNYPALAELGRGTRARRYEMRTAPAWGAAGWNHPRLG